MFSKLLRQMIKFYLFIKSNYISSIELNQISSLRLAGAVGSDFYSSWIAALVHWLSKSYPHEVTWPIQWLNHNRHIQAIKKLDTNNSTLGKP